MNLASPSIFVRNDLLEIDLYAVNFNTDILALILDILDQLRAVKQALGGDAADVQAGTAKVLTLNDGHLCAELSKPDRRNIAAGAAADNNDLFLADRLDRCGRSRGRKGDRGCRGSAADLFTRLTDITEQALDRNILALLSDDLEKYTVVFTSDLVGELICGDLQDRLAGFDRVTLVLEPTGYCAFFHRQSQLGHNNLKSHTFASLREECSSGFAADRAGP